MTLISEMIEPFKPANAREALSDNGVSGVTMAEVKGFGR